MGETHCYRCPEPKNETRNHIGKKEVGLYDDTISNLMAAMDDVIWRQQTEETLIIVNEQSILIELNNNNGILGHDMAKK